MLKRWVGSYRWVYNQTVDLLERGYEASGSSGSYMKNRKDWIAELREKAPWLTLIPAHTTYGAMTAADRDYKRVVAERTKGKKVDLPRCRRHTQRSCFILGNAITPGGVYPRILGNLKTRTPLPNHPSDSRLLLECGRWYLLIPEKLQTNRAENQGRMCAVDPGVRTFATVFAPDGLAKIGDGTFQRIVRLCLALDDLLSRASKAPARRRKRMKQAAGRARRKIRRLVEDIHYQTIGWLFRNYDTIVFPEADFTSAVKRTKRKIGRKSVRSLLTWCFATFRDRLVHSAERKGKNVVIVNESYTSRTANFTGEIVNNLGGRKTIVSRGVRVDRDVNGALGIFLKALLDQPVACYRNC